MTVYLDVILVENICMNYIILFATGYIMKLKLHHLKIILASLVGAIYAIVAYMQILPIYSNIITKIVLSIVIIYISFKPKNLKICFKQLLMFYLVSFIFGGCAFALLYVVKPQDILMKNGVYIGTYPIKIAILGALIGFILTYATFKLIKEKISKKNITYELDIYLNDKTLNLISMLDTGNLLKDPITQTPVVLVEKEKLYGLLPKKILDNLEKIIGGDEITDISEDEKNEYLSKFRIIPFNSVGKQNGMLVGIKTDKIIIDDEEIINDVIIGIFNGKFDKHDKYSALIGLNILERRNENELITNIKI